MALFCGFFAQNKHRMLDVAVHIAKVLPFNSVTTSHQQRCYFTVKAFTT